MRLEDTFTEFTFAKDHSPASRRWYSTRLSAFIAWLHDMGCNDIEQVTPALVRRYVEYRRGTPTAKGTPLSTHTLHGIVRSIKTFLNWAARDELIDERITKRIELPKKEQKIIPIFTPEQIDRLLMACDQSDTHEYRVRNRAIVSLLLDTGIRANELCTLKLENVHLSENDSYILVYGKGRKQREVPVGKAARSALHRYLHRARPRGESPYVFLARGGQAFLPNGIDQVLYRLRDTAGAAHFKNVRVSAHTFRHTYAVRSLEAGLDLYKLSRLLGHTSVMTTENYLKAFSSRQARQGSISVLDTMQG